MNTIDLLTAECVVIVPNGSNKTLIKTDTVVQALGIRSVNRLAKEGESKVKQTYTIGHDRESRQIRDAITGCYVIAYGL